MTKEHKENEQTLPGRVVRVRWVKSYHEAHNHVAIGQVLNETPHYLTLLCRTYHFGNNIRGRNAKLPAQTHAAGIGAGERAVRSVPWSRIEVIHELPDGTEWDVSARIDENGACLLENDHETVVSRVRKMTHL